MRIRWLVIWLALFLVVGLPRLVSASVDVSGVEFDSAATVEGRELDLVGTGVARYGLFIKVYAAAFYAQPEASRDDFLAGDRTVRLEIEYFRELEPSMLIEAANKTLDRQLSASEREAVAERVERLHEWYEPIQTGDRYALSYVPGQGTSLAFNGEVVGTIPGEDFARAYLGIWLGDNPLSDSLRADLLAGLMSR